MEASQTERFPTDIEELRQQFASWRNKCTVLYDSMAILRCCNSSRVSNSRRAVTESKSLAYSSGAAGRRPPNPPSDLSYANLGRNREWRRRFESGRKFHRAQFVRQKNRDCLTSGYPELPFPLLLPRILEQEN